MAASDEHWAIILGASEGTGAAIARAVARDPGFHIFGVHRGRHPAAAEAVVRDIIASGRQVQMRIGDAGTREGARLGAKEVLSRVGPGRTRLLVHSIANASVGSLLGSSGKRLSVRHIEKTFNSMAHSFVYWVQELVEHDLLAPSALLLGLTNPVVGSLVPGLGAVAASKAALEIYVRQLAAELGPLGHRVNLLNFGLVDTPAGRVAFPAEMWDKVVARASDVTPARRLCKVEEVGRFVSVLSGDAGAWFNGATIDFTGGMTQTLLGAVLHRA